MRRRALATFAAGLLAAVSLLFSPSPAQATAICGPIRFYDSVFGPYGLLRYHDACDRPGCFLMPRDGVENLTSYIDNNYVQRIRVYDARGCTAAPYLDIAADYTGGLQAYGWNDRISAYYVYCPPAPYTC